MRGRNEGAAVENAVAAELGAERPPAPGWVQPPGTGVGMASDSDLARDSAQMPGGPGLPVRQANGRDV